MQNGVTISTKESDLEVKYGMTHFIEEGKGARTSLKHILIDMNDIRTSYIRLGFHLEEFKSNAYYYDFGFPSMEEFCAANLGMDKSAVSRCINVYRKFNGSNFTKYEAGIKTIGSSMEIDERYKDYSYSQLCEMVSMDEEQRKQVTPDMTIKQIREVKKGNVSQNVSPVSTSQLDKFSICKFDGLKGIVRQNYVKNIIPENDNIPLYIFDKDGKNVFYGMIVNLLKFDSKEGVYIRLNTDVEKSYLIDIE